MCEREDQHTYQLCESLVQTETKKEKFIFYIFWFDDGTHFALILRNTVLVSVCIGGYLISMLPIKSCINQGYRRSIIGTEGHTATQHKIHRLWTTNHIASFPVKVSFLSRLQNMNMVSSCSPTRWTNELEGRAKWCWKHWGSQRTVL